MFSIGDILRANAGTFYNYRTNKKEVPVIRYVLILLVSILAALTFGRVHDDLYTGLIAVQSILVGFAFNVLFYLAANPINITSDQSDLESKAKIIKLNKLGNEVFYNISYFNIVSVISIALACIMLLSNAFSPVRIDMPDIVHRNLDIAKIKAALDLISILSLRLLIWLTFACTLESIATFARIVKRMTYLFRERMLLERR